MRSLALAMAAALLACGVKAPPRPPLREEPDAGASASAADGGTAPHAAPHPDPLPASRGEGDVKPP